VTLKPLRYLLVFTSIIVIFFAAKYAIANLHYLKIDSYLARWQEYQEPQQDELTDALEAVDAMLTLHGHFPHYLNVAAKVYEWHAFTHIDDPLIYQASQAQALAYYKASTVLRLHWPLTWVFMANVKANLGQFDDEFYDYIDKAMTYGPYAYQVNLQIAKFQLQYWGELEGLPTKVGLEHIKRALLNKHSRYVLLYYARDIERLGLLCTVARLNGIALIANHHTCR